jgi:hypothetical protein
MIWAAFSRFCHTEMNLEPETVMRAWYPPAQGWLDKLRYASSDAQIDQAMLEEYETLLVQAWHELGEGAYGVLHGY